jgi:HK97 gp10 family phage protein
VANRNGFSVKVDIKGLDGVVKTMRELGPKLARKGLRKSLRAVGNYWVPEMKSRVPVDTGSLRDSVIQQVKTKRDKNGEVSGTVTVGPEYTGLGSQDPGVYAMWVEFGVKSKPKYPVSPFARRTLDATGENAVKIFSETLKTVLEEILKKQTHAA